MGYSSSVVYLDKFDTLLGLEGGYPSGNFIIESNSELSPLVIAGVVQKIENVKIGELARVLQELHDSLTNFHVGGVVEGEITIEQGSQSTESSQGVDIALGDIEIADDFAELYQLLPGPGSVPENVHDLHYLLHF